MTILQPENNFVPYPKVEEANMISNNFDKDFNKEHEYHSVHENLHGVDTDKKMDEMAREAYLMRREVAIIAGIFFLLLIGIALFAIGSMTQVTLPV
jgi:hypothetical protein